MTASYWAFTLTDGALRMLVLLHLHGQGRTAWALALMLVPYEIAGVITNLFGGWLAARRGQKPVLLCGLALQVGACLLLAVPAAWLTIGYVMTAQVLSGVAKDFAKTASKSYVRALAPTARSGALFGAVAWLTGSKNVAKGLGFFLGGALLSWVGFRAANLLLAALLLASLLVGALALPAVAGRSSAGLRSLFAHAAAVHWLALARLFLFGSRDAWFAVALPLFLSTTFGWTSASVGAFLAAWIIGYGIVQARTPRLAPTTDLAAGSRRTVLATFVLLAPLAMTWLALQTDVAGVWVTVGLLLYGVVFAVASSLHSWLVVALADGDTVAERVGFYYAANALGRLVGLLVSGWLYAAQGGGAAGLGATVVAAAVAVVIAGCALLPAPALTSKTP